MDEQRIWDHFQTTRVDAFDRARGRYAAMAAQAVRRQGGATGRVLNIGIGAGGLERLMKARGWTVAALDPSPAAVAPLVEEAIDARCAVAQDMPFETGLFDIVVASEVLEHIEPATRAQALAEIHRVLKPGGWLIGSVPYCEVLADHEVICPDCGKVFHRWGHVSSFDLAQMHGELAARFDAVSCRRLSFVDWSAARTPGRFIKALAQSLLGRMGEAIASPSIEFAARKPLAA